MVTDLQSQTLTDGSLQSYDLDDISLSRDPNTELPGHTYD